MCVTFFSVLVTPLHAAFESRQVKVKNKLNEERTASISCKSVGHGIEGHEFEICWRHFFVSLSKTLYSLLSTGSTQEDRKVSYHKTEKLVTGT